MSNILNYKGYCGSVEVSVEDDVLHGKIQCVNDIVTFEADTPAGLKVAFEEAVDDYLETCKQLGKSPDKPMSGTFNVRIGPELHKKAFLAAVADKTTLNDYVRKAIEEKVSGKTEVHYHLEHQEIKKVFTGEYVAKSFSRTRWAGVGDKWSRH